MFLPFEPCSGGVSGFDIIAFFFNAHCSKDFFSSGATYTATIL